MQHPVLEGAARLPCILFILNHSLIYLAYRYPGFAFGGGAFPYGSSSRSSQTFIIRMAALSGFSIIVSRCASSRLLLQQGYGQLANL